MPVAVAVGAVEAAAHDGAVGSVLVETHYHFFLLLAAVQQGIVLRIAPKVI